MRNTNRTGGMKSCKYYKTCGSIDNCKRCHEKAFKLTTAKKLSKKEKEYLKTCEDVINDFYKKNETKINDFYSKYLTDMLFFGRSELNLDKFIKEELMK